MESPESTPETSTAPASLFWKLDRSLQILMAVELGYLCLLIVGGVVFLILALLDIGDSSFWLFNNIWLLLIGAPLLLAYLGNLSCGLVGLILHVREKVTGYPGTGHLLNWIFIIATAWIFLFFILILAPTLSAPAYMD